MKVFQFFIVILFFGTAVLPQTTEILTNNDVILMQKSSLGKSLMIRKIEESKNTFDVSVQSLVALKNAGIDEEIINAMIESKNEKSPDSVSITFLPKDINSNDPLSEHNFGIYLYEEINGGQKMTQLEPNISTQNRTVGKFTAGFVPFGLGIVKTKTELLGTAADLQLEQERPVFYFYLDAKSGGLNTSSGIPSTTTEFLLVNFSVHDGNRQLTISRKNAYKVKGGLPDENVIKFISEDLGKGIFKVTPGGDLKNGEYGFYLINSGNSNTSIGIGAKFFDFGIKLPK